MPILTGYVTESHGKKGFTIKVTEDDVTDEKGKHPQVSKEAKIYINPIHYPYNESCYVRVEIMDDNRSNLIDKCISVSEGLKKGDRVKCDEKVDTNTNSYSINDDPNVRQTYTKYPLWLDPNLDTFKRLGVDTPETLKFRKQLYIMDRNRNTCEKITGDSSQKYNKSWWINKNRIIAFPYFIGLWVKTKISNLWVYLSGKNLTVLGIILTVALAILGIVATILVGIIYR